MTKSSFVQVLLAAGTKFGAGSHEGSLEGFDVEIDHEGAPVSGDLGSPGGIGNDAVRE